MEYFQVHYQYFSFLDVYTKQNNTKNPEAPPPQIYLLYVYIRVLGNVQFYSDVPYYSRKIN